MKIVKKSFLSILIALMLTAGFSNAALASELDAVYNPLQNTEAASDNNIDLDAEAEANLTEDATLAEAEDIGADDMSGDDIADEDDVQADEASQEAALEEEEKASEDMTTTAKEADAEVVAEEAEEVTVEEVIIQKPSYSEKDLRLLASLIYAEAGDQSYNGMLAVANVVLNRVKSNTYWHVNTIEEVIFDNKWAVQFSVTIKSKKSGLSLLDKALKGYDTGIFSGRNQEAEQKAMNKAIKAAKAALEGKNNIGDYLCFRVNRNTSSLRKKYPDYKVIGDHIFYRTK